MIWVLASMSYFPCHCYSTDAPYLCKQNATPKQPRCRGTVYYEHTLHNMDFIRTYLRAIKKALLHLKPLEIQVPYLNFHSPSSVGYSSKLGPGSESSRTYFLGISCKATTSFDIIQTYLLSIQTDVTDTFIAGHLESNPKTHKNKNSDQTPQR